MTRRLIICRPATLKANEINSLGEKMASPPATYKQLHDALNLALLAGLLVLIVVVW